MLKLVKITTKKKIPDRDRIDYIPYFDKQQFVAKYPFEDVVSIIKKYATKIDANKEKGIEMPETQRQTAELISGVVAYYRDEIEANDILAQELISIMDNLDEFCQNDWCHNLHTGDLRYEPMASNIANYYVEKFSQKPFYPQDVYYLPFNKHAFMSVNSEKAIKIIENYMANHFSDGSLATAYAVISNPNIDEKYRETLCTELLKNSKYINGYATNLNEKMQNMFLAKFKSNCALRNESHFTMLNSFDYLAKACPNKLDNLEGIKEFAKGMHNEEMLYALSKMYRYYRNTYNDDIGILSFIKENLDENANYNDIDKNDISLNENGRYIVEMRDEIKSELRYKLAKEEQQNDNSFNER